MLWPVTAHRNETGQLLIGGVDVPALAETFGTPLYVYDEATIRDRCRAYQRAFAEHYPRPRVVYAGKAYLSAALLEILAEEGLSLDVVSGGELFLAHRAGFPAERIVFHGNNKAEEELALALDLGIGEIVVDNHYELDLLTHLLPEHGRTIDIMLRINPRVDAHTHEFRKTGVADSKFGLLIETGDAAQALERVLAMPGARFRGYHAHVGSQIFETEPFTASVDVLFRFAAAMRERFGVDPAEVSPGGGFGIQYESSDPETSIEAYAAAVAGAVRQAAERYGFDLPTLTVEPGRSIVGPAGVAIYRVGAIKDVPGIRRYVCLDGGMADNIRPALYDARYEAALANRATDGAALVTLAGKYCESGDVLIRDVTLPDLQAGDLVAIPATGAYCLAMASNYNLALKPAAVLVREGIPRLMQRRERFEDLLAREMTISEGATNS